MAEGKRFNPPPNWPPPPPGWTPPEGWEPDPAWGPPPSGWNLWLDEGVLWEGRGQPVTGIGAGRYKLTRTTLFFEKGALRTNAQQVPLVRVTDVDMRQAMTQKAREVGDVLVHVRRDGRVETVRLEDLPQPRHVVAMINHAVHEARIEEQRRANTMTYSQQAPPPAPAAPAPAAAPDPIEQLRKLGELRDAGVLTDEEFEAKKAAILARM